MTDQLFAELRKMRSTRQAAVIAGVPKTSQRMSTVSSASGIPRPERIA
jgi:hypothetical protein